MNHKLNIPITVTTAQCHSVLDTACENIGYWELEFRNRETNNGYTSAIEVHCTDGPPLFALPGSDDADGPWAVINEHTVVRGLHNIIEKRDICAECIRAEIIRMLGDQGNGIEYCDTEQADVIIQAGLFGELVYG